MPVKSDYYTRSEAYKNAHRHGSINHPQDISFLDDWYVDSDDVSTRRVVRPRGRVRRAASPELIQEYSDEAEAEAEEGEHEEDVQDLLWRKAKSHLVPALGYYLIVVFLLQVPFLVVFMICVPTIFHFMSSPHSKRSLSAFLSDIKAVLQSRPSGALERRQSIGVMPNTLIPAPPAGGNPLWLFDYRTYFSAALDAEDPYKGMNPIYQNRRTFREALADTLPREYRSLKEAGILFCDMVEFQAKWSIAVTIINLVVVYFRDNKRLAQLQWVPRIPNSLDIIVEMVTIDWNQPANALTLQVCRFWWDWIYGLGWFLFWRLPKAVGIAFWNAAIKGVMIPGEYVKGSVAGNNVSDAWGHGLHPLAHECVHAKRV